MKDEFKKWSDRYIFAYMFVDKPNLAMNLSYIQKFNNMNATFSDLRQMGKRFGKDYLVKLSAVNQGVDYLMKEADGYGISPKMIIDSASLKIFLLYLLLSDAKKHTLKSIIEGMFYNLGYRIRLKLDEQLALKALPVAFFNGSAVFGYPARQGDNISSKLYISISQSMGELQSELIKMSESEAYDDEFKNACLMHSNKVEDGFLNIMLYLIIS